MGFRPSTENEDESPSLLRQISASLGFEDPDPGAAASCVDMRAQEQRHVDARWHERALECVWIDEQTHMYV